MRNRSAIVAATKSALAVPGQRGRRRTIALLAAILGLDMAEMGAAAAVSDQLRQAFHIGNTEIGLLIAVVSFVGAAATLPMGVLADRVSRRRILIVAVALWAAAMALSGVVTSYVHLLATRLLLGIVTAAAWPCVASLTGDIFAPRERASIYGLILSGELIGVGAGFFVSGEISSLFGWRAGFLVMVLPSLALVWAIHRYLPEPPRGGQSWLSTARRRSRRWPRSSLYRRVREAEIRPRKRLVLHEDPTGWPWPRALFYLLRVPSYTLLIAASTLAYFFFAGLRAFGMIYFTGHYGIARGVVSALVFALGVGAIAGLIAGARLSGMLLDRGWLNARLIVPAAALFLSLPFFALGLWTRDAALGILLISIGTGALSAAMAPIDAARLDIVHPRLWGRGEGGRMAVRATFEGAAPLLFGALSAWLGGGDRGLMWTFLVMLLPMIAAAVLIVPGCRTYPRDVATAAASLGATPPPSR